MAKQEFTFTKQALDALPLPPKGKRATYHDKKVPGLQLRITDTGKKSFSICRRVNGIVTRHTIGPYPDLAIEYARNKAKEAIGDIAKGENPNDKARAERNDLTLAALFARYLEDHAKRHKRSWEGDVWQFNKYLAQRWGNRRVAAISRNDVKELHKLVGENHGHYAANRLVAQLRALYNFAKNEELLAGENPAEGIRPYAEQSRDRRLHADEMPAFVQALDDEPNEDIRDYVMLSLLTAARKANVLAMRWDEINLERATWTIPHTKNGKPQTVPLVMEAVALLRHRRTSAGASPFVFPGTGGSGHLADPKKGWNRILERAGIKDLRLHDLRRTMGSYMADTGASLHVIGKALNHQSPGTTAVYARLAQEPVRASMEAAVNTMFKPNKTAKKRTK